ncbi:piggyBac transposable element-derived protein 4-like [Hoplias malabaricus]|uniref:piggyBac transposable element-derived protein 4-like n=1 Tax=Hoplias malabaricus TaxID=27720 RepID=UPI003462B23D
MAHSRLTAAEALLHIQESFASESEEDFSSSDESGEDSDEERLYFEKRIDPKEDFCEGNVENTPSPGKRKRRRPSLQPPTCRGGAHGPSTSALNVENTPPPGKRQPRRPSLQPPTCRAGAHGPSTSALNVENIPPPCKRQRRRPSLQPQTCRAETHGPSTSALVQPPSWENEVVEDVCPPPLRFLPAREPGVQLRKGDCYTPLSLFKLFFPKDAVEVLCRNTNKQAAKNIARGAKYRWLDVDVAEFYKYIGLIIYMSMVNLKHISDFWRKSNIFSIHFPSTVMSRDRYRSISWNVHMSDPDEDRLNDAKRGTSEHDRLFRCKPLMNTVQNACKSFYHPHRNLAVDERMVPCRGHNSMTQYMKDKPTKWGFKLFVLADSSNGYTVDFSVYTGKNNFPTGQGLSYDSVMSLVDKSFLGSGYHVYMDNFYTSPKLFKDLYACKFGACGTYRESRKDCPRTTVNALTKKSPRGTFRWIRDGPLLFVKWMDTREVAICSTIHTVFKGDTVQRRVKSKLGIWTTEFFPCPTPLIEYNKFMGGVDLSDQLIQYYTTQHKTLKWYRKLFLLGHCCYQCLHSPQTTYAAGQPDPQGIHGRAC